MARPIISNLWPGAS